MTNATAQNLPPKSLAEVEPLEQIAARMSAGYSEAIQSALVLSMAEYHTTATSILGDAIQVHADPRKHKTMTVSRLILAGLSHVKKAQALYREVMTAYGMQVAKLAREIPSLSEPFIDSLTCSLKNVHHRPDSVARFLEEYVAPANEERDGWRWQYRADLGNKFYYQRVDVSRHGQHIFALFFDLKNEQEDHDFVMFDCVKGNASQAWHFFKDHVEELRIAIARVDVALDAHFTKSFETLLALAQSHRISWSKSVVPRYGSFNMDNPAQGRTAYFGKIPGVKGGRANTFTIRIYDKGLELQQQNPDLVADMTEDEIRNYSRIECSSSPGTPDEKEELAIAMAKDIRAAWGLKQFTAELIEKIEGHAVERTRPTKSVEKTGEEKKIWLLQTYSRMLREFYGGQSVLDLILDMKHIAGVEVDTFGLLENLTEPADPSRQEEYQQVREYLEYNAEFDQETAEIARERASKKLTTANAALVSGDEVRKGANCPPF